MGTLCDYVIYRQLYGNINRFEGQVPIYGTRRELRNTDDLKNYLKRTDFFSKHGVYMTWVHVLGACGISAACVDGWKILVGIKNQPNDVERVEWVELFRRIRNRFVHRNCYFLSNDIDEMRTLLNIQGQMDETDVIHNFLGDVVSKMVELSNYHLS